MRDAVTIVSEDSVLEVERWASGWLGAAWSAAGLGEREPEKMLHLEVVGRASTRPSPHGLAAVAALRRVAVPDEWLFLADWLPRKAALDAKQRAALPDELRRWI